ncbi:ABC transporter [Pelagophyceae sp. CCMP2097]|nr:ABC transporter [Pelagophyceae sp. CCMP2097]
MFRLGPALVRRRVCGAQRWISKEEYQSIVMVGAVASSGKVVEAWTAMKEHFQTKGLALDVMFFTSYERQVEALLVGFVDVAWNSPLAHVRAQKRLSGKTVGLAMRDVDYDCETLLVTRKDYGSVPEIQSLKGKRLAVGSYDSPRACMLPIQALADLGGIDLLKTMHVTRFDRDIGTHGDCGRDEVEVIQALLVNRADFGVVSRAALKAPSNVEAVKGLRIIEGIFQPRGPASGMYDSHHFDSSPRLHDEKKSRFSSCLLDMSAAVPQQKRVMQLFGCKNKWIPPREGYYDELRWVLQDEAMRPFPQIPHSPEAHPFKTLELR